LCTISFGIFEKDKRKVILGPATTANLLFEYSTVNANIKGDVTSIKNPTSGKIVVEGKVGEIIWDENQKEPKDAVVLCK